MRAGVALNRADLKTVSAALRDGDAAAVGCVDGCGIIGQFDHVRVLVEVEGRPFIDVHQTIDVRFFAEVDDRLRSGASGLNNNGLRTIDGLNDAVVVEGLVPILVPADRHAGCCRTRGNDRAVVARFGIAVTPFAVIDADCGSLRRLSNYGSFVLQDSSNMRVAVRVVNHAGAGELVPALGALAGDEAASASELL